MTTDQPDLNATSIERERLDFDKQEARRAADLEERRFRLDKRSRWWTPLSVGLPLITFVFTTIFTNAAEHFKHIRYHREAELKERRTFIERQLAQFYFPLLSASEADDLYWCLVIPDSAGCKQRLESGIRATTLPASFSMSSSSARAAIAGRSSPKRRVSESVTQSRTASMRF
jgi:hypothetical protein